MFVCYFVCVWFVVCVGCSSVVILCCVDCGFGGCLLWFLVVFDSLCGCICCLGVAFRLWYLIACYFRGGR